MGAGGIAAGGWAAGAERTAVGCRIDIARLLLVAGLVFIHYGGFPGETTNAFQAFDRTSVPGAAFVASTVLYFFFSAVPVLSLIAGWLFFRDREAGPGLAAAVMRRGRSLVLPLLLWNGAVLLTGAAVWLAGHPDWVMAALGVDVADAGALQWLNAVLGITRPPAALQFWFVRDLIVAVLVSPLVWPLLSRRPWLVALPFALWLFGLPTGLFLRPDVPLFFWLGGLLRRHGDPLALDRLAVTPLLLAFVALVTARAALPGLVTEQDPATAWWLGVGTRLVRLLGVVTCWRLVAALAAGPLGAWLSGQSRHAFFIFALHYPLVLAVKDVAALVTPPGHDGWMLANYLVSVAATIALCVLASRALSARWPGLHRVLNGGRGV